MHDRVNIDKANIFLTKLLGLVLIATVAGVAILLY
jgi:hypothetical protein